MSEKILGDSPAREAIRRQVDRNFLVEAGAGSGKTTCLVDRMAALCSSGHCGIQNIAAVTFTRKAAGDLKERFQVRLEGMFRHERDPGAKELLGQALTEMDQAFVGTIHSFCSRLLRERPVEAGIAPDFEEIEGLEERLLEETAWSEYLLRVSLQEPHLLDKLGDLDLSPGDLREAFGKISSYPEVDMVSAPAPYPRLSPVRDSLEDLCARAKTLLPSLQPEKGWDDLQLLARLALRWQRTFDLREDRYLFRLLEIMDRSPKPTYNRWPSKEDALELAAAFENFREEHVKPVLQAWREHRHHFLVGFLSPAVEHYGALRLRENKLNFQDLLMKARDLLRDNPEVRRYFQERYTCLLVDEFQDTDPIQAEVMLYLTGDDPGERNWTNIKPKPGSLFVVGDPKQSIYRFRRADIDTYYRVKDIMAKSGGEVLRLTSNFRSLPGLVDWLNPTFNAIFSQAVPPYQAEFAPMEHVRGEDAGTFSGVFTFRLSDVANRQEEIAREDARSIAAWIRQALEGSITLSRSPEETAQGLGEIPVPGDFLILVHYKAYMALYARALEALGIPFTLSGGGDISGSLELREMLPVLRAIRDPDDPVALTAALRGIFFGISDDLLYRFKAEGGRFSFLSRVPESASAEITSALSPAWDTLGRYWRWARDLPPSSALERIVSELGILPLALAGELGRGRAGYLLQVLDLIRKKEEQDASFGSAVDLVVRLVEEGLEEELDIEGGGSPAVRIMNLHKAKGLEAPVVILANPGRNPRHDPDLHVRRDAQGSQGHILVERPSTYHRTVLAQPMNWERFKEEEGRYQEAEGSRLLYVAATRARNLLVISTYPKKPEKSPWHALEGTVGGSLPCLPQPPFEEGGKPPVTPLMLEDARAKIREDMREMTAATYARLRATETTKDMPFPKRNYPGRGKEWGTIIHRALETLVKDPQACGNLDALATEVLRSGDFPSDYREEVLKALDEVTSSAFWARVLSAPERHAEIPFGGWEHDRYLTGTIDLAFREEDGWTLVDYKTDAVEDENHLAELERYYRPQVEFYRRFWEKHCGERVAEIGLFFTDNLRYQSIKGKC